MLSCIFLYFDITFITYFEVDMCLFRIEIMHFILCNLNMAAQGFVNNDVTCPSIVTVFYHTMTSNQTYLPCHCIVQ